METNKAAAAKTRKYRTYITGRACENFGAVSYSITETITERDGGLYIEIHSYGMCEGERVDQRSAKFWPGGKLENAHAYRMANGYILLA